MRNLLAALSLAFLTVMSFGQSVTVTNSMVKVHPGDGPGPSTSAEIHAAQNEFEAFQVIVSGPATGVSATAPTLTGPGGATIPASEVRLYREAYLNITTASNTEGSTGMWPDALVPDVDETNNEKRNAFPFDVPAGENRVIWVEVHVPKGQTGGTYTGNMTVTGSGLGTQTVPVTLLVWNFELPSTSSLASTFGMGWDDACVAHFGSYTACGGDAGVERMHVMYAEFMLNHHITADVVYTGPTSCTGSTCDWTHFDSVYGALFDGTDSNVRLQGAKQTSIRFVWSGGYNLDHYTSWAQHFRAKGWFDRTYDYTCDEPPATCAWTDIPNRASVVHSADAQFRTLVTTTIADANNNGVTSSINILSPVVNDMDDKAGNSQFTGNQRSTYNSFLTNTNNRLWWYQSCMSEGCGSPPKDPYFSGWPSFMVDVNAVQNRSQGMLSWLYGVTGVLYYETTLHLDTAWTNIYDFGGNGDGTLLYPGKPSVIGGTTDVPVASIRLKMIRDGFEDYEYMKMVSDLGDPTFAQQTGQALFPDVFASNQTPAALSNAREQLAQRILQLKGQGGPTVSMTAPANGSTVSGTITLSATASDPNGVAGVTFLVDGTATGSEVTTSPYSMQYNTTALANGSHTFAARARNTAGATTTSTAVTVTVSNTGTGGLTLTTAMALSPTSPVVNQSTTATFTVQNTGTAAMTIQYFLVGARDPSNANVDFPASPTVTLQPGQSYTYSGTKSFATAGTYSAWPAYFDGTNWIQLASPVNFTVGAAGPGKITLVTALALSPTSPVVNQSTTATFTVQNTGGSAISVPYFLVGARDPSNANVDFPASASVTLQPGQQYTYSASRSFATAGAYTAWPAYFDGTNWNQLATPASFTVQAPSPGQLTLTTALALSPAGPAVGQSTTATFTITNTGGSPVSVQYFLAGARDPSNANVDFPASAAVTLQPGQSYNYSGTRSFSTAGTYTAWPAYFDGTNWIQMATATSYSVH